MKVARGGRGKAVPTRVIATNSGQNGQSVVLMEAESGMQLKDIPNVPKNNANDVRKQATPADVCTSSLLDAPEKSTSPTSGTRHLMYMRLASHVFVAAIIGMIHYDIGSDATKVLSNVGCIFYTSLFTMFTAMMPAILICMLPKLEGEEEN